MINHRDHWLRILFSNRFRISLSRLSGFQGFGFRFPLKGLSSFQVTLALVVPEHPVPVPVCRYFYFSVYFFVYFKHLCLIVLCFRIGCFFVT